MHFLRVFSSPNLNAWDGKPDKDLAKDVFGEAFGARDGRPSLYLVNSQADELRTAAAFALTAPNRELKNYFVVRIFQPDLDDFGLLINDDEPGTTGVVDVDFQHFEGVKWPETTTAVVALTARIRDSASEGAERFRWVAARFQKLHFERFLKLPDGEVIAEAKRRCRFKMGLGDSSHAGPDEICAELDASKPTLPRFRVERAAFLIYCARVHLALSGCPDDDWTSAEDRLRRTYKKGFR